jgi:hypothetical protein
MALSACDNPNGEGVADFGNIVGRVLNSQNQQPISLGTVSVGSTVVLNLSTADQGGFVLQRVPIGTQTLIISAPGYNPHQEQIQVQKDQTSQAGEGGIVRLDPTYMSAPQTTATALAPSSTATPSTILTAPPPLTPATRPSAPS